MVEAPPEPAVVEEPEPESIETSEPDPVLFEAPTPSPKKSESSQKLIPLQEAIHRIPEPLRKEMEDLLRANFREVRRWDSETKA